MAKKHRCPEFENHERWLISYADMLTLLFAVFVVLYSISISGQKSESAKLSGSMQEAFNQPLEEIPENRKVGPSERGMGIFEHLAGKDIRPNIIQKYPGSTQLIKVIEDEMKTIKMKLEERLYGPNKFRQNEKTGEARIVSVQRTAKGFTLRLVARHFFDPGQTAIKRAALKDLDQITDILRDLGRPITIEGHTDSTPAAGQYTNWEISTLRATNVLKYMVYVKNFPVSLISAVGYADLKPIAHNGTDAGRALNRRIEIQVNYDEQNSVEPSKQPSD